MRGFCSSAPARYGHTAAKPLHLPAPASRFAVEVATPTASSRQASHALDALCALLPAPPRAVLSENGAEFQGHFHARLEERGITH